MAKNEDKLNEKISNEIKKYGVLKSSFQNIFKSEEKASKARIENYDKINTIKETDNNQLVDIYKEFINEMKLLEEKRKQHLGKINDLIIPVTELYPEKLKNTKKKLDDLIKLRKNKTKVLKNQEKAKINNDVNEAQKLNAELARQLEEEKKKGENLETEIMGFEKERIENNKFLFLQYIHSELKYHAASLEKMSLLFNKINSIEPREELVEFKKRYGINLSLSAIKVNMNEIMEEQQRKKSYQQRKRDNVYGESYIEGSNNNINAVNNNVPGEQINNFNDIKTSNINVEM